MPRHAANGSSTAPTRPPASLAGIFFPLFTLRGINDVETMVTCIEAQRASGSGLGAGSRRWRGVAHLSLWLTVGLRSCFPDSAGAAEPEPANREIASPALGTNVPSSFLLRPGFRIELVASEPMIAGPVAMAFDENGRLFVVEMRGYPDRRGANLGRVRLLENMDDQGVFQNSTIYADNLPWPSAVACYSGGIFVAAAPDILYFKDTKGDGIADARQVVLSGLGGTNTLEADLLPNNFNWGPDNRIHAASGGVGGEISSKNGDKVVPIDRCDFSFDPRTLEIFPESGPAQSGLSFDSYGRKFVSDFVRPLMSPMYELRYTQRNPFYPKPAALVAVGNVPMPAYRYTAQLAQGATGHQATNAVAPGWLTRARGCVVYRGRGFPTNYFGNVFIADPEAHIVHRVVLREDGLAVTAQRAADEPNTEFLISKDPSFRPVQLINGPDGALYIADMQDGNERGRIYRVLPEKAKRGKPPQLGTAKTYDLVGTLAQGDGWHRDTAARLLYERKDPAAPALLRGTLGRSRIPQARLFALRALQGAGVLTEDDVLAALRDTDDRVREHGLRVAESLFRDGRTSGAIEAQLRGLLNDPSPRVRYQLAFTLGELPQSNPAQALGRLAAGDLNNVWMQNAVLSSTLGEAGGLFTILAGDARFRAEAVGFNFLRVMATMIGVSGRQNSVAQATTFLARSRLESGPTYALLYQLGEGLYRTRSSLALTDGQNVVQPLYASALDLAVDPNQSEALRAAATHFLSVSTLPTALVADWLLLVCSPPTTPALQTAAVEALSWHDDPQSASGLLRLWPLLAPVARGSTISALLARDSQVGVVLNALQSGAILPTDLTSSQRNFLRTHPAPAIRQRALQRLGPVPMNRSEVMQRYKAAAASRGAPERGRDIFRLKCAACHQAAATDPSMRLGPDLLRARTFTREQLLSKILEPNLSVRPDYETRMLESKEGQILVGILVDENSVAVNLNTAGGETVVWPQLNIRSLRPLNWSLMPEGLEVGLSPQDLGDLIEYVQRGAR
jgi:putative membrane-bound dehydrogenase-like protein